MNAGQENGGRSVDAHEYDVVMPGFRFHPTEEELLDFYLRRKVEGKPFNVELIVFLDLYRYDPWELPTFAAIGEKEWFFYVPRDRKYRNGDRPNRVTTSGYWKATGADRMVRGEGARPIGLKKTLVFYTGKAPKGVRTGWIMNEYRLPHDETERSHKVEISLCRVYKRAGVEARCYQLQAGNLPSRPPSSSRGPTSIKKRNPTSHQQAPAKGKLQIPAGDHPDSSSNIATVKVSGRSVIPHPGVDAPSVPELLPRHGGVYCATDPMAVSLSSTTTEEEASSLQRSKDMGDLVPACRMLGSISSCMPAATVDELNRIVGLQQSYVTDQAFPLLSQPPVAGASALAFYHTTAAADRSLWECWNAVPDSDQMNCTGFK